MAASGEAEPANIKIAIVIRVTKSARPVNVQFCA
jgi:hypothetical protein